MNTIVKLSRAALPAALLLLATHGPLGAQQLEAVRNPHLGVSDDGQVFPVPKGLKIPAQDEAFEGFAPAGLLGARFEDTGAAVDGAEPVLDETADFWELLGLPTANGVGSLKSILGPDTRSQVNATTTYPWRSIVLITFTGGRCTGWLYGTDIVATAGHCVHTGGSTGTWSTNVRVYPGRNGSSSPYGSCTARRLYSVQGWTASKNEDYDYGAIKLDCTVGQSTGWLGYFWQPASLNGSAVTVAGYPGDKPLTHWRSTGSISVSQSLQLYYLHDTFGGQSGAPVFQNRSGCGQCAMAIHGHGVHGLSPHSQYNHGVRITQSVFNNLMTWKNAP